MIYDKMYRVVKDLEFDKEIFLVNDGDNKLSIIRPSRLSGRFRDYDMARNFQIFLTEGERHFRPNHLRVMIDLNLRVRCRPDLKEALLLIFDNIFYGRDPDEEVKQIEKEHFAHFLNPIRIIANLAQLFIIEQEYAYNKQSKYDPVTLFFQGWIREMIDNPKEIDNMVMSVCSRQPPLSKYVCFENKKSKNYKTNLPPLWYLK